MKPVSRDEILDIAAYEEIREPFRRRIIEAKKQRRLALGDHMTVVFENHDTALFQIQEMLRTERITAEPAILHELETYNGLVPGENELSLTLFIEYGDKAERDEMLVKLAGVEECFDLCVGKVRFPVQMEDRGERTDRTTAVHYGKIPLTAGVREALLAAGNRCVLRVKHAEYEAETELGAETRRSLSEDLASE